MAVPDVRFSFFDFSKDEKADNLDHINSLLQQCETLLDSYQRDPRDFVLHETRILVKNAMWMANDPDACEYPPLTRCYLCKGRILWATQKYSEAREAFRRASKAPNHSPGDQDLTAQAIALELRMEIESREMKRKGGIWSSTYKRISAQFNQVKKVRYPGKYRDERLKKQALRYNLPPLQEARRSCSLVTKPQLHEIPQPQRLVENDGVWTAEVIPASESEDDSRNGLQRLVDHSVARGIKNYLTIRKV
ncbi:hypothetical protein F4819DRAFT_504622 [Hypoxylon fuscum]|nr:hypothetical protein F4819DRAFT_504622 [Hypoxylon fuscum]